MSPIDRWRHSPPEDEPAPLEAIRSAIQASYHGRNAASMPNIRPFPSDSASSRSDSVYQLDFLNSSATSSGSSGNSWSSAVSSNHPSDTGDGHSAVRREPRRRKQKRRRRPAVTSELLAGKEIQRIYQCTFCTDTFASRYDWTRHEGTLHLPLDRWTCVPIGPRYIKSGEDNARCALCDAIDPSDDHILTHNAAACTAKSLSARVYHRKDHLRQHLRLVHHVADVTSSMDSWKSQLVKIKSRCGFCGETFTKWSDRNDHLVDHFRAGALMKEWKGCRGLEPAIALLVENAIPPYLIGTEATDPDPFSALRPGSKSFSQANATYSSPRTTFEQLTARLGEYVHTTISSGVLVTDELLRKEARVILNGDDDPWNQTPADNPQWLNMFKLGYGLTVPAMVDHIPSDSSLATANVYAEGHHREELESILSTLPVGEAPFTMENMHHAAGDNAMFLPLACSTNLEGHEGDVTSGVYIPWSWQTPECLAEFRQMGCIPTLTTCNAASEPLATATLCPNASGKPSCSAVPQAYMPSASLLESLGTITDSEALICADPFADNFRVNSMPINPEQNDDPFPDHL
ncbi:hypothetical protein NPX13_g8028 [Xylaria arbuscula]|uniref:C2H2-type domain-containing protein n=1 Tax=Xylaria arbuscula TaxID=114810 RepID=A0A9W8TKJ9_9PEZI|nr:hypothetical protein NPX13_g8028 [Xylaria arbuscula]